MNGKGDKRRPMKVSSEEYSSNWDLIFNKKKQPANDAKKKKHQHNITKKEEHHLNRKRGK